MDLKKYEQLTGKTVDDENKVEVLAQIRRAQSKLETMLGYSLNKNKASDNQYEEKGKTMSDCAFDPLDGELSAADEVIDSYRLFPYKDSDVYLLTDPFLKLNTVKLVFVQQGEEPSGITVKTFDSHDVRVQKRNGFSYAIQKDERTWCLCRCKYGSVQLAVDAQWLSTDCMPDELAYLLADMVTYETDCEKNVKSETVGPHSKSYFENPNPSETDLNQKIIQKYAGPNGTAFINVSL